MDINPLSLLEVTLGKDGPATEGEDDDCVIIEDDDPPFGNNLNGDDCVEPDQEVLADMGVHFLQQVEEPTEDPLALPSLPALKRKPMSWIMQHKNNLMMVSAAEATFRSNYYKDLIDVLNEKLHCTICMEHIGCDIRIHPDTIEHPILKVLTCQRCIVAYNTTTFSCNDYQQEMACRWCAGITKNSSCLLQCVRCPFAFCEGCLIHNNSMPQPHTRSSWTCIVCRGKDLWPARRLLWGLQSLIKHLLSRSSSFVSEGDISKCCPPGRLKSKNNLRRNQRKQQHVIREFDNQNNNNDINTPKRNYLSVSEQVRILTSPQLSHTHLPTPGSSMSAVSVQRMVSHPQVTQRLPGLNENTTVPETQAYPTVRCKNIEQMISPSVQKYSHPLDTKWLTTKIDGYITDLTNIRNQLSKVKDSLSPIDSLENTENKVNTVTTLLSLNSNLFRDCSINLMNEWREKKSRMALDRISAVTSSLESTPSPKQLNNLVLNKQQSHAKLRKPLNHTSNAGKVTKKLIKKNSPLKIDMFKHMNNNTKQIKNKKSVTSQENLKLLFETYGIMDCEVRLIRLRPDVELKSIFNENNT